MFLIQLITREQPPVLRSRFKWLILSSNTKKMIKVLLADDHKIFRDGIRSILEKETDIQVVEEASDGKEVIEKIRKTDVDVVLLDLDIGRPNGIEICEIIKRDHPEVRILILSMMGLHDFIIQALEKGAPDFY